MHARPTPAPTAHAHPLAGRGIVLLLFALACFATLDTATKVVTAEVPLLMALWFRYAIQAVGATLWSWPGRGWKLVSTRHPGQQITRGVLMLLVTALAFASLGLLPVGEFTAIVMSTPLLVTLLAARVLGERLSGLRVLLVLGGFVGTLAVARPGGDFQSWALLLPVGLVLANAAFQLLTSHMMRSEDAHTTQFYSSWVGTLLATLPLAWVWTPIHDPVMWACLLLMGAAGGMGHFLLIRAFEYAPASSLMPFTYAQIGFGMLGGWLVFSHIPDTWSLLGIGLIACCGIAGGLLTRRENLVLRYQSRQ